MHRFRRSGLALAVAFAVFAPAFAVDKFETDHLAQLARQLGSSDYTEREAAERELDAAGVPALPVLRNAALSEDLEIRRRADALLQQIEKRAESAKLLEPRTVRLTYQNVPLREALADFNAKTGIFGQLGSDAAQENPNPSQLNRKISLDTGEVAIWEALDQFCRASGLVEQQLVTRNVPSARDVSRVEMERNARVVRRLPAVEGGVSAVPTHRTILVDGVNPRLPTSIVGPIRIRALTSQIPLGGFRKTDKEVQLSLEVSGDSKLSWLHFGNLRIEKAIDDLGQNLTPLLAVPAAASSSPALDELVWVDAHHRTNALAVPPYRVVSTRLALGPKPSTVLRELSGTLSGQVQTPSEPLMTFDNLGRSIGQVVRSADGCSMEVRDLKHAENGDLTVRVCIRVPHPPQIVNPLQRGVRVRVGRNRTAVTSPLGPTNPAIIDADGKTIPAQAQIRTEDAVDATVQEITLTCRVATLRASSAKLVYSGPRTIVIEVPFELMDVPLK